MKKRGHKNAMKTAYYEKYGWPIGEKKCTFCSEIKDVKDYYRYASGILGRHARCKKCTSKRTIEQRAGRKAKTRTEPKLIALEILRSAKERAKRKDMVFCLNIEDILPLPVYCPVLGIKLVYLGNGRMQPDSASLDRFDNEKGYVPGNITIISTRANILKRDATLKEIEAIRNWMETMEVVH